VVPKTTYLHAYLRSLAVFNVQVTHCLTLNCAVLKTQWNIVGMLQASILYLVKFWFTAKWPLFS